MIEINCVEGIVFEGKKCLNEKHIEEQLEHSNFQAATLQYPPKLRKQRQKLQNCGNYQPCRKSLEEGFAKQVIIDCRTTPAVDFKAKSGFRQHDPIMTQDQSVLTKIMTVFAAEEIILQYNVSGHRVDAYLLKYKLGIEIDEQGHNGRSIDYEIERKKAIERKLGCKFIRINPATENLNIFVELSRIQNLITKSTKKSLIDELSKR